MAADILPTPPSMMAFVAAPPPPPPPTTTTTTARTALPVPVDMSPAAAPVEAPEEILPETGLETTGLDLSRWHRRWRGRWRDWRYRRRVAVAATSAPAAGGTDPGRRQYQASTEDQARRAGLSVDCHASTRAGCCDHRGPRSVRTASSWMRKCYGLFPCSMPRRSTLCGNGSSRPTLLNGVPVPVIMTVTVNFTLQ